MSARIERIQCGQDGDRNAWLIGDDDEVIVIDPGDDAAAILAATAEREILAVICTHGHGAHTGAAAEVADSDEAPVALHPADRMLWRDSHPDGDADIDMEEGGIFEVGGVALEVLYTPGHTVGSVSVYCEELGAVFTGDTIGEDGPVPHDGEFPDFPAQLSAIGEEILTLSPETRILPGHGPEFTVADAEKRFDSWAEASGITSGLPE